MRPIVLAALAPLLVAGALATPPRTLAAGLPFVVRARIATVPHLAHHRAHARTARHLMRHGAHAHTARHLANVHAARVGAARVGAARPHAPAHARRQQPAVPAVSPEKQQMLDLINAERAQAGAGPLGFDPTLNAVAQARSQDMIDRHYFSHQIPGGGMVFDILDRDHVQYEMAGENIALNNYIDFYPMARTIQQTNTDLMNSPEHRANILERKYTKIGLGVAFEHGTGKMILTEVFVQP